MKFLKKILFAVLGIFLFNSCDPFSEAKEKKISLESQTLYVLSETWGIGGGHYKICISADKRIDEDDLLFGGDFELLYSIEGDNLIVHLSEARNIEIPNNLAHIVILKRYTSIEYIKLLRKSDSIKGLYLYYPFDSDN